MPRSKFLGEYHFSAAHSIRISATPSTVYAILTEMDFSESWLVRFLFKLRGLPRYAGHGIEGLRKMGFILLDQQQDKEVMLGLIGQFWKAKGSIVKCTAEEFSTFTNPDFAKATWLFAIRPIDGNQIELFTETCIGCADEHARKKFARYWFFIGPFSGLLRMVILKSIKRKAEKK